MDFQPYQNYQGETDRFSYRERHAHRRVLIERTVEAAGSFLLITLGIRFVLALFGANPANPFATFVYSFTTPFVTPFYNLFSYDHPSLGVASFEGYTLISMAVYGLATGMLARLASLTRYN